MVIPGLFGIFDIKKIIFKLYRPAGYGRLVQTVSEQLQPHFLGGNGWWATFGWFFILVIFGSIFIFYNIFKGSKKISIGLTSSYIVFFMAFIFGRLSSAPKFSGMVRFFTNA